MTPEQQKALALARARKRKAEAETQPKKKKAGPLRQAEGLVRGVTSGLLGAGDLAAAAGDVVGGQIVRPLIGRERLPLDETFERVRADRRQLERETPVASGVGNVAGALAPISRIGRIANSLGIGLKAGKGVSNTAKTAAAGAASAGVTAKNLGADNKEAAQAAGLGAVASPAVGVLTRLGGTGVNFVRSAIDRNKDSGFRVLAKALRKEGNRVSPEALRKRADEFRNTTGRAPTITELVGERGGQDVLETVQGSGRATETLLSAAERRAAALQDNLASNIEGGRVTTGTPRLLERRGASMDKVMREIGDEPVTLGADQLEVLLDPDIARSIPRAARRALLDIEETGGGEIDLRTVDNIRQAFRKASQGGGEAVKFSELADALRDDVSDQIPRYGAALGEFQRRSVTSDAVKKGAGIRGAETREFEQAAERAGAAEGAGLRVGARGALADTARQSPQQAASVARSLADDTGLARRLQALDPEEAARLRDVGRAETDSLRSVASTVRGAQVKSSSQESLENAKSFFETAALASGRASGGFQANFATKLIQRFKVPPTAAKKLAEAVTDAERTDEVIDILMRAGVKPREIEQLARAASRATSRSVGAASQGE